MADRLTGLEVWGDVECNGGSKLADLPFPFSASEEADLNGDHRVEVHLDRTDASWASVAFERVLRATFADGDVSEWRIREVEQARGADNARIGIVRADHIKYDLLHRSGLLERVEKNGTVWNHFEYYGLSPTAHAEVILGEAPDFFTLGTVANNERVDMIYHQDNPLSALEELASVTGLELEVVRNGATDYRVNLVVKRGDSASTVTIEHAANLLSQSRSQSSADMGTQIYPRGGQEYGDEGSISNHAFTVGSDQGTTLVFEDDLFSENDQLNGKYIEDNAGAFIQITDTVAPRTIVLASDPTVSGDRRIRFKRKFTDPISGDVYGALTYLPSPSAIAQYGIKPALLDRSDIPLIDNLAPNPLLVDWDGGLPRHWNSYGGPGLSRNEDPLYTRHGTGSLHVTTGGAGSVGQGIFSDPIPVTPTEEAPFFVVQIQLYVVSGHVRLELIDLTNGVAFPPIGKDAATVAQETWIDSFGVAPGGDVEDNFYTSTVPGKVTTEHFQIRVTQIGEDPADFYLDAVQLTQTATFRQVIYGGYASNDLWLLAKEALEIIQTPSAEYDVDLIDFNRLDPSTYSSDEIVLGGPVQLTDAGLGLDVLTRILSYTMNWLVEGDTQIEVEGKTNDLTRILGETERRIRKKLAGPYGEEGTTTGVDLDQEEDETGGDSINIRDEESCEEAEAEYCTPDSAGDLQLEPWSDIVLLAPVADDGPTETNWDGLAISWSAEGKVTITDGTGDGGEGETNAEGTMKKTGTGLLEHHPLDTLTGLTVDVGPTTFRYIRGVPWLELLTPYTMVHLDMTPVSKMRAQVQFRQPDRPTGELELIAKAAGSFATFADVTGYGHRMGSPFTKLMRLTTGGIPLSQNALDGHLEDWHYGHCSIFVEDGNQWAGQQGNPSHSASDTYFDGASGVVALRNWNSETGKMALFRNLYVTNGEPITVTGLTVGYKVVCADVTVVATSDTVLLQLPASDLLPVRRIRVRDGSDVELATFSPESGIFDGDTFIFDESGTLVGESDFDSQVVVDLEFYGMDYLADYPNWTYLSTAHGLPTRDAEYEERNINGTTTIPVGTMMIRPVMRREGGAQAIACVQHFILSVGTAIPEWIPCDVRFAEGYYGEARIPTDEGLLFHLAFDDYKLPKPNCTLDYDGVGPGAPGLRALDTDGSILLSRLEYDSSPKQNHFALETLYWKAPDSIVGADIYYGATDPDEVYLEEFGSFPQPCFGVSGLARVSPDWYYWGFIPTTGAYYCYEPAPSDIAPALQRWTERPVMDVFENFTVSFWFRPFLHSYIENIVIANWGEDNSTFPHYNWLTPPWGGEWKNEGGGYRIWLRYGWDMVGHLLFQWNTHDNRYTWDSGHADLGPRAIYWNADPCFGESDTDSVPTGKARDDGRSMAGQWAFYAISVSPNYAGVNPETNRDWEGMGEVCDVTVYHGNSLTGYFKKLTDSDLWAPNSGYYHSSKSLSSILPFSHVDNGGSAFRGGLHQNEMTRFTVFGDSVLEPQILSAGNDWDPASGAMDEVRFYERELSDGEVYGLFMLGCGSQPHTQASSSILKSIAGAGAENSPLYNDQIEQDGIDPHALIRISPLSI